MSIRQLWEGTDCAEWAQSLDGRTKFLLLLFLSTLILVVDNPRTLFYAFSFSLSLHIAARTSLYKWEILSLLILVGVWGSMITQSLFFSEMDRTPLITLVASDHPLLGKLTGGIIIYREGLIYGAVQGLRSASMLTMGLFVCWTSDPRQLLKALTAWRLPVQIAFMVVTALRFLPVLAAEAGEVLIALQLRSATAAGRGGILLHLPQIANPLLARSLRRAQTLSLTVISRGFLQAKAGQDHDWPVGEKIVSVCLILLAVLLAVCKLTYLWAEQGFYYNQLRCLYDFARLYL